MLKLQLRLQPQCFVKLAFSTITLGRDESNHLVLEDASVSDFHAEVVCENHRYYIVDLMSAGGTFVNQQRVSAKVELNSWDIIRLGSVELELCDTNQCRPGDWALRSSSNDLGHQFYQLRPESVIGRDADCDIVIDSSLLSRRHARLVIEDDCLKVEDLQSSNGTFINNTRVENGKAYPGDELRFDQQVFVVLGPSQSQIFPGPDDEGRTQLRPPPGSTVLPSADVTRLGVGISPTLMPSPSQPSSSEHAPAGPSPAVAEPPQSVPEIEPCAEETQFLGNMDAVPPAPMQAVARLIEKNGSSPQSWELHPRSYCLGREDSNDIVLAEPSVSKSHARMDYVDSGWSIENLGARNGIKINGALVEQARLQSGDEIALGRVFLEFTAEKAAADPMVTVYYKAPDPEDDVTRPVPVEKMPTKASSVGIGYGLILLIAGLGIAVLIYLWRAGLLEPLRRSLQQWL